MLMASVLSVVAGGPVQAANTSGEELIDTNGDGVPDSREFAGSHRYNTAVTLAEQFADDEGSISTVIIASGETEVDAVTAAGLAGNLNAPVLLTRSNMLPHNVARFIDEHNVTDVRVVGGTAAVPDSIITAIEALGSRPDVKRVSGADRYATAAAIGSELGGPNPTWCGSDQPAAILVNGGADGRADAVAVGPLANALGLPILLTGADEVPGSTASFLTDNKVEHVVVVGGTSAVSAGVVNTLVEDIGVVTTRRISGGTAAATSVKIAQEMLGNCAVVLGTNRDMVALVNRDAVADGIAAAPVLGRGIGDDGPVPILLVGDELPAAVSDFLGGTVNMRGGMKTHLRTLAIGGTAVVSADVMKDALDAAWTSSELTAMIAPMKDAQGAYTDTFTVKYSDLVKLPPEAPDTITAANAAAARGTVLDPTLYKLNGRRLEALLPDSSGNSDEKASVRTLVFSADLTVTVELSHKLKAGDTITVDPSLIERAGGRLGANGDKRKLMSEPLTLVAVSSPVDRTAPAVEIVAVPGQSFFDVIVHEKSALLLNDLGTVSAAGLLTKVGDDIANNVTFTAVHIPEDPAADDDPDEDGDTEDAVVGSKRTARQIAVSDTLPTQPTAVGGSGGKIRMRFGITVTNPTPEPPSTRVLKQYARDGQIVDPANVLRAGDTITVKGGAVRDARGLRNSQFRYTVPQIKLNPSVATCRAGDLTISSVSIGDYTHTKQATAVFGDPGSTLKITAKEGGVADGAAGNDWVIYGYDDRPREDSHNVAFDIDVAVDVAHKVISYTISNAVPAREIDRVATLEDLATALVSNSDFNSNFSIDFGNRAAQTKSTPLRETDPTGEHFGDEGANGTETVGRTAVGVLVKFNADVRSLRDAGATGNGTDLAYDIAPGGPNGFPTGLTEGTAATNAAPNAYDVTFEAPDDVVHIKYTSNEMSQLPKRAGLRLIAADVAVGYGDGSLRRAYGATCVPAYDDSAADGAPNKRYLVTSLRLDSSIKP